MEPIRDGSQFMMPFAVGATALMAGLTILELTTHGQLKPSDNLGDIYFAIMGAYAGAGEIKQWFLKEPDPPELQDPWLERARKGGWFVTLWLLLYMAAVLIRVVDPACPMPAELKKVTLGILGIFFVSFSSRRIRKGRKSTTGGESGETADSAPRILQVLGENPQGLTRRELGDKLSDVHPRSLQRSLIVLLQDERVLREGHPKSPDARYLLRK